MRSTPYESVTLVFDGTCGFCTRSLTWAQRLDRRGRITPLASQQPGVAERFGLTPQDVATAVWAIDAAGRRHRGAAAVNAALAAAVGTSLPVRIYRLPIVRQLQDAVYALVARHRSRLPGVTPWCERHPGACAAG